MPIIQGENTQKLFPSYAHGDTPVKDQPMRLGLLFYSAQRGWAETWGPSLRSLGFTLQVVTTSEEMARALEKDRWDLILADVAGPFTEGTLHRWQAFQPEAEVWLLLDKEAPTPVSDRLSRRGALRVFRKPTLLVDLIDPLNHVLESRAVDLSPGSVLLVSPEAPICEALGDFFFRRDIHVRSARYDWEVPEELLREHYGVVLIDDALPGATALISQLHSHDPHVSLIVMSERGRWEPLLLLSRREGFDVVTRPVDPFALDKAVARALERHRWVCQNQRMLTTLRRSTGDLVRLNEMRSRFFSVVSHDLKTPLTSLKGFSQSLLTGLIPLERYPRCFELMIRSAQQMERLIDDLMDIAGLEAGKLRMEPEDISAGEVLQPVFERFRPLAGERGIHFVVEGLDPGGRLLRADPRRLDQALSNLLGNALKHTPTGGTIRVIVDPSPSALRVTVKDTGCGLAVQNLARVFDLFFQVESSPTKRDGLGLGLAIAKEIVQAHGGDIGAFSEGVGRGSAFWISLPWLKEESPSTGKDVSVRNRPHSRNDDTGDPFKEGA